MIKLIIFDLDGVLVDARELHYEALNRALGNIDDEFMISREEHLSTYDGLPTTKKLNLLSEEKGLDRSLHQEIWEDKQTRCPGSTKTARRWPTRSSSGAAT